MEPYDVQQRDLERRMLRAQALRETPMPQGGMVSGHYVRPSWTQYLAAGLKQYAGAKDEQSATKQLQEMAQRRQDAMALALRGGAEYFQDQPGQSAPGTEEDPGYTIAGRKANPMAGYRAWAQSQFPELQKAGILGMGQQAQFEAQTKAQSERDAAAAAARAQENEENRKFRAQELQMRNEADLARLREANQLRMDVLAAQNASAADRAAAEREFKAQQMALQQAFQREMKKLGGAIAGAKTPPADPESQLGLNKQFGKPPAGFRWKQDGSMEPIPGGPADRKTNEQQAGKETVDSVVAQLRQSYDALDKGGGITSTQQGALSNIGRTLSKSAAGQFVGGALGSQNQKERDAIAQARPLLLQAIMKATGMSAKQMDSNAELKLYLATATDPTLSLEANKEALNRIAELYGSGGTPAKPPPLSPEDAQARDWAIKNPNDPRAKQIMLRLGG